MTWVLWMVFVMAGGAPTYVPLSLFDTEALCKRAAMYVEESMVRDFGPDPWTRYACEPLNEETPK